MEERVQLDPETLIEAYCRGVFPMADEDGLADAQLIGDIVLAFGVCAAAAADKKVALETHAAHLVVHGTLHLLGYDHEQGEEEAEAMEAVEREALAALGIADPYPAEAGS